MSPAAPRAHHRPMPVSAPPLHAPRLRRRAPAARPPCRPRASTDDRASRPPNAAALTYANRERARAGLGRSGSTPGSRRSPTPGRRHGHENELSHNQPDGRNVFDLLSSADIARYRRGRDHRLELHVELHDRRPRTRYSQWINSRGHNAIVMSRRLQLRRASAWRSHPTAVDATGPASSSRAPTGRRRWVKQSSADQAVLHVDAKRVTVPLDRRRHQAPGADLGLALLRDRRAGPMAATG